MNNFELFQERLKAFTTIEKDSLIENKINTFQRALDSSYNSETVRMGTSEFQALISRIDTMPKIERNSFSTLTENNCDVGDIIYWVRDNSYWIITEQLETEEAIFQSFMDKSLYELSWKDLDTGIVYTQRACAKGPDQTVISDGVKKSIMFDNFTDSLYLLIPADTDGVNLLTRYFDIMINGKKWNIEVLDNITKDKLITLQLKETAINRDTDTSVLVDGLTPIDFVLTTALDDITEIALNSIITLNPILTKNGILDTHSYTIVTTNCTNTNGIITFNTLGTAVVQIRYPLLDKIYRFTIDVVSSSSESITNTMILGSETVKAMSTNIYTVSNLLNGNEIPLNGTWTIDTNYVTIISSTTSTITLRFLNKTGDIVLTYVDGATTITKNIKVIPMFGGS